MTAVNRVRSPCIDVCALDDNDICIGCWRHVDEIGAWRDLDDPARRAIIAKARQRCQQSLVAPDPVETSQVGTGQVEA